MVKRTIIQAVMIAGLALLAAVLVFFIHPKAPALYESSVPVENEVTLEELSEWQGEIVWIDAREKLDFERGHVAGALLLNQEDWADLMWQHRGVIESIEEAAVIVYCDGKRCRRSADIAERLRNELGLERVYVFKGDWRKL